MFMLAKYDSFFSLSSFLIQLISRDNEMLVIKNNLVQNWRISVCSGTGKLIQCTGS